MEKGGLVSERPTTSITCAVKEEVAANNTRIVIDAVKSVGAIYSYWQGYERMMLEGFLNIAYLFLIHSSHFAVEYWRLRAAFE